MDGFARVAVGIPRVHVTDVEQNAAETLAVWRDAQRREVQVVTFPELGLSSYTARDLFFDAALQERALAALKTLVDASRELRPLAVVGLPLATPRGVYNVAAV